MSHFPETGGDTTTLAQDLGTLIGLSSGDRLLKGWVGPGDGHDYFQFFFNTTSLLQLSISGLEGDANLFFYNSSGTLLLGNSLLRGTINDVITMQMAPNTYYVRVTPVGSAASHYNLSLNSSLDAAGEWTNASMEMGLIDVVGKTVTGWVGTGDSLDYYRFMTATTGNLLLQLTGLTADEDLKLFNESGTFLLASSLLAGTKGETIAIQLNPGSYYSVVSRKSGSSNYSLAMNLTPDTAPNTPSPSPNLTIEPTLTGWLGTAIGWVGQNDTFDYYQFIMVSSGNVTLTLSDLDADANLALFNNAGTSQIAISQLIGTTADVIYRQLAPGSYQARVSRVGTKNTNYELRLAAENDTGGDTPATAPAFAPSIETITGWVGIGDTFDYYRILVGTTGNVSLTLSGLSQDANLHLFNGTGSQLITASLLTGTNNDIIERQLTLGTYYARVSRGPITATDYSLVYLFKDDTGGDTALAATPFAGMTVTGWLGIGDQYDYHQFVVSNSGDLLFSLTGEDNDVGLFIYNANGTTLLASSLTSANNTETLYRYFTPGTYTARATRTNTLNTDYTMTLKYLNQAGGNTTGAQNVGNISVFSLDPAFTCAGWVGTSDPYDYYQFSVNTNAETKLSLTQLTGSATFDLFSATGSRIMTATTTGSEAKYLYHHLTIGNYYARVGRGSSASTSYQLDFWGINIPDGGNTLETALNRGNLFVSYSDIIDTNYELTYDFGFSIAGDDTETMHADIHLGDMFGNGNIDLFLNGPSGEVSNSQELGNREELIHTEIASGAYQVVARNIGIESTTVTLNFQMTFDHYTWVGEWDDHDVYKWILPTTGHIDLRLTNMTENANLYLLSSTGSVIAYSVNGGTSNDSIARQLSAGTYYGRVTRAGSVGTNYTITSSGWAETGGDTAATATPFVCTMPGWVGSGDLADWYSFSLNDTGNIALTLSGMNRDANLFLYNGSNTQLITSSLLASGADEAIIRQVSGGNYLVKVTANAANSTTYLLQLDYTPDTGGNNATNATDVGALNSLENTYTGWVGSGDLTNDPLTLTGWLGVGDTFDFFRFIVATSGMVTMTLTDLVADANLALYNETGTSLIQSSLKTGTNNDVILRQLMGGTYLARVNRMGTTVTDFSLYLSTEPDTAWNTPTDAADMALDSTVTGWVGVGDSFDYYRLTLNQSGHIALELADLEANANLFLFNDTGSLLIASSQLTGTNHDKILYHLSAGVYMARVTNSGLLNTEYTLTCFFTGETGGDLSDTAPDLNSDTSVTGWVGNGDSFDYYRFVTTTQGRVVLYMDDMNGNANLALFDETGTVQVASSSNGGTLEDDIQISLSAGTFFARVQRTPAANSSYHLYYYDQDSGGDTLDTAPILAVNASGWDGVRGWLGNGDSQDVYRFVNSITGNLSLALTNLDRDANLYLLNDAGTSTMAAALLAGTVDDAINIQLVPGTYLVRPTRVGNNGTRYDLSLTFEEPDNAGETPATANPLGDLASGQIINGFVGNADTVDIFQFDLQATGNITLQLSGLTADANLVLLDDTGQTLTVANLDGVATEIIRQQVSVGTYYAVVLQGSGDTDYNLLLDAANDLGGDSMSTGISIAINSSTREWLGVGDSVDFFRFSLNTSQNISLTLTNLTDVVDLALLDSSGATMGRSFETGTTWELISRQLAPGTYYAQTMGSGINGDYTLDLNTFQDGGSSTGSSRDLGTLATTAVTASGWLSSGNTLDYYRFALSSRMMVTLDLTRMEDNANLKLYDASGSQVLAYPVLPGTVPERVAMELSTGTYYAAIFGQLATSDYLLTLTASDEAGASTTTATDVGTLLMNTGRALQGYVNSSDTDFYRFVLAESAFTSLQLENLAGSFNLALLSANGSTLIPYGTLGGTASFGANREGGFACDLSAGTYYVRLVGSSGATDYTLRLNADDTALADSGDAAFELGILNTSLADWGMITPTDTLDIFRFELVATTAVNFILGGLSADLDLFLYDQGGTSLYGSTTSGTGAESLNPTLSAGVYLAAVTAASGNANSSYNLAINPSPASRQNLGSVSNSRRQVMDWVGSHDTYDFYTFSLSNTSTVTLALNNLVADAELYLLDGADWQAGPDQAVLVDWLDNYSNNILSFSTQLGTTSEILTETLTAGVYYVAVVQRSGNTNYLLQLDAVDAAAPATVFAPPSVATSGNVLGLLSSQITINGFVGSSDWLDVYSFNLNTSRNVNLSLTGMDGDGELLLLDDFNIDTIPPETGLATWMDSWSVATLGSSRTLGNENINANLSSGTYYVAVFQGSGDTNYQLVLTTAATTGRSPAALVRNDSAWFDASSTLNPANLGLITQLGRIRQQGWMGGNDGGDDYLFQTATQGDFSITVTGGTGSYYLYQEGSTSTMALTSGSMGDPPHRLNLDVGSYRLQLQNNDSTGSNYLFTIVNS